MACLLGTGLAGMANALPLYAISAIGSPDEPGFAWGINNVSQVSGYSNDPLSGRNHAFVTADMRSQGSLASRANPPTVTPSEAYGINDAGQVAGTLRDPAGSRRAVVWDGASLVDLGTLGGSWAIAVAINNAGQVAGSSATGADGCEHAFIYSHAGMQGIGAQCGVGRAINASGQVVGATWGAGLPLHAFMYGAGGMTELGAFGGADSIATAINDAGQVAGYYLVGGHQHAFLWDQGVVTDLGGLPGVSGSVAYGISKAGVVLGSERGSAQGNRAMIWDGGAAIDLNTLLDSSASGWTLEAATATNDAGQIVGYGINGRGNVAAFLLTPIPEPATLFLLGLALAALGWQRKPQIEHLANPPPGIGT
jgi:probable HAF family extracellular repeat protein